MAFAFSRRSFDQVASQLVAGTAPQTPGRIGLFFIEKAEVNRQGIVCLWTDNDPAGPNGFVQNSNPDVTFNLWSKLRLDETWHFIAED